MTMNLRVKFAGMAMSAAALALVAATPASAAGPGASAYVGQTTSLTPVAVQGGGGAYTFNSLLCVGAYVNSTSAGACVITSSGTYSNIVCGTGSASGSATVTWTGPIGSGSETVSYGITFVAGVGVMTGGADGAVVIVATGSGLPDTSQCVTQFTVVGASVFPS